MMASEPLPGSAVLHGSVEDDRTEPEVPVDCPGPRHHDRERTAKETERDCSPDGERWRARADG